MVHRIFREPLDEPERHRAQGALGVLRMLVVWDGDRRAFLNATGGWPPELLYFLARVVEGEWEHPWPASGDPHPFGHPLLDDLARHVRD
jgi:hypothetical protein